MSYRTRRRPRHTLGRTIRQIRKRLDQNQAEFASALGWPRHLICKYELGVITPSTERLIRLLRFVNGDTRIATYREPILTLIKGKGVLPTDLSPALESAESVGRSMSNFNERSDSETSA